MGTTMDQSSLDIPETKPEKILKKLALLATSFFFIFTGLRHLMLPDFYIILMPRFMPVPFFLIYLTGALQIVCALGLLFSKTRKMAAAGLMFFLLASLPVLIYMWVYKDPFETSSYVLSWLKMLSIPLQFALIFWVYLFWKRPEAY